jgi:hypothetical protein
LERSENKVENDERKKKGGTVCQSLKEGTNKVHTFGGAITERNIITNRAINAQKKRPEGRRKSKGGQFRPTVRKPSFPPF